MNPTLYKMKLATSIMIGLAWALSVLPALAQDGSASYLKDALESARANLSSLVCTTGHYPIDAKARWQRIHVSGIASIQLGGSTHMILPVVLPSLANRDDDGSQLWEFVWAFHPPKEVKSWRIVNEDGELVNLRNFYPVDKIKGFEYLEHNRPPVLSGIIVQAVPLGEESKLNSATVVYVLLEVEEVKSLYMPVCGALLNPGAPRMRLEYFFGQMGISLPSE